MKNRIGIVMIAIVSMMFGCFFAAGCTPLPGYIAIDPQSELMNPTFSICGDEYFQERLQIGSIKVEKVLQPSEAKRRWELDSLQIESQTVWELTSTFPDTESIVVAIWGRLSTPTVSSLTYGEVPRGYAEKVKAVPLEPEQLYIVEMDAYWLRRISPLKFIIRLSETDTPDRLEYRFGLPSAYAYIGDGIFQQTRSHLSLD